MISKRVASTQAQNNFGQLLDDVAHNDTRYVIERRGKATALLLSLEDFGRLLEDAGLRQQMVTLLGELRPRYDLGEPLEGEHSHET